MSESLRRLLETLQLRWEMTEDQLILFAEAHRSEAVVLMGVILLVGIGLQWRTYRQDRAVYGRCWARRIMPKRMHLSLCVCSVLLLGVGIYTFYDIKDYNLSYNAAAQRLFYTSLFCLLFYTKNWFSQLALALTITYNIYRLTEGVTIAWLPGFQQAIEWLLTGTDYVDYKIQLLLIVIILLFINTILWLFPRYSPVSS